MTANKNISRVFRAEDAISCQTVDKRFRDSRLHTGGLIAVMPLASLIVLVWLASAAVHQWLLHR